MRVLPFRGARFAAPAFSILLAAAPSFAADSTSTLVSDFEDGLGGNNLLGRWFYFNDEASGGNSKVTTADTSHGWWDSTSLGAGYGGSKYCGRLGFRFGDKKAGKCDSTACNQWNDAGIGTELKYLDSVQDIRGATSLTFMAKAATPMKVVFLLNTFNVKDYSFYRQTFAIGVDWKQYTVTLKRSASFAQAAWGNPQVPLDLGMVTGISWDATTADNPGLKGDTLSLDDVRINGWKWVDPFGLGIGPRPISMGAAGSGAGRAGGLRHGRILETLQGSDGSLWIGDASGRGTRSRPVAEMGK